ncbi:MAG TPA: hypothetical protein VF720_00520, partial [Candidatus Eisenbacteria bacterium]
NLHVVYTSRVQLPGGGDELFSPVLESLPGAVNDDVRWNEVEVIFTPGSIPRQYTSSTEVISAMAAGDVVLTPTGARYAMNLISISPDDPPGERMVRGDLLKPIAVPDEDVNVTWGYVKGRIRR